ncbi:hypothetical protein AMAG_20315 [Allomyces macrogynus ATCC 38327]|uniref:Nitrogen regulatory protein areA GATA-like domain-containing protein n=1 Tax=Allomyces macrogynus (strain ATCC 38327) TaxID=578462 RepID=A0A0L0T833_ALLM3|nr:hypothetical protein AMAG_20315 [Allomyces macrogynus ATCC 38327]|eukprot:KNE70724.1 hypothetical protein AMAG_20315 [Allomyces macrogynus ATCC 38327]
MDPAGGQRASPSPVPTTSTNRKPGDASTGASTTTRLVSKVLADTLHFPEIPPHRRTRRDSPDLLPTQHQNDAADVDPDEAAAAATRDENQELWRLYTKAKDALPNGKRMENLTWRLMALSVHQPNNSSKPPSRTRRASLPSSSDQVAETLAANARRTASPPATTAPAAAQARPHPMWGPHFAPPPAATSGAAVAPAADPSPGRRDEDVFLDVAMRESDDADGDVAMTEILTTRTTAEAAAATAREPWPSCPPLPAADAGSDATLHRKSKRPRQASFSESVGEYPTTSTAVAAPTPVTATTTGPTHVSVSAPCTPHPPPLVAGSPPTLHATQSSPAVPTTTPTPPSTTTAASLQHPNSQRPTAPTAKRARNRHKTSPLFGEAS